MAGFLCRTPASTSICMASDHRRVLEPEKSAKLLDVKYSRLVESKRFSSIPSKTPPPKNEGLRRVKSERSDRKMPEKILRLPQPSDSKRVFQVVVMRVSLHCRGCAGKVKKHISKMEGVTSFSIDLETKRVTVMGHISPLGVLESVSKVKRAELWSAAATV
ncbi:protein SODIUM POTASSIUM ROOT DEFECTIVE 1 isoform X1 [Amborella trichopoda]|uniref:HMA domain-containing protein n=2 Tax=Amborella trichopoda TaxID=13333 RepID=W1NGF5_AMBTC|nr:protein SODIUM POTASSIUM ROOT DEFECTIVE 1 isoform X1 [Amborella trichopoda]XP_020518942.1 protein SODIUM POTASSIUM ROOT DEFECTIVE 1 isoform X1 [Amborella trichopoda]ERM94230.1 hypothetical protein AMTR_s00010p00210890 [Amborella trichopoda]|eukprot:XP_011621508.1 protein SODIUM POTASSIUM ROOT DEFECTIVE 1 isoform X1 [Amborella trichopoda]